MANISKIRTLVAGIPTTVDLTASGTALQAYDLQITNSGVTASKPAKLDSNKKIVSGNIDLTSEVTGTLPIANGGTGSTTQVWVDLTADQTVGGIKTFTSFPVGPSSAPTTNYQLANKKYVDDSVSTGIVGAMIYKGGFDASAGNFSAIVDPKAGWFYKVSVAGTLSGTEFLVGDNMYINKNVTGSPVIADIDKIDNTELVTSVNSQIGAVVLDTDDISEGTTNKYFTDTRAKAAAVADLITDGVTDVAPSQNAVYDALALKANDSVVVKTVNGQSPTAGAVTISTDNVSEGSTNKYFTDARAKAAAVSDSITDGVIDVAPSQNAVFDALALKDNLGVKTFPAIAGEGFSANTTYIVRFAVGASETAGRVYKATSDAQNAPGKYTACGVIQTTGAVSAGDAVTVIRYAADLTLKSADTVIGSSTDDNGKILWLNKSGAFGLAPSTGITVGESFANLSIGIIKNYDSTVTNQKVMIDISLGNLTGIDIA